ncbi:hypothetical protein N407_05710 [Helicobacter pylori FD662]|uniref:Uncharacterized protein n=1 Tax=Helicobacter pylori UM114 TaxID=1355531 RepID=T0EVE0_HELPX|nr:hypothetical protein N207_05930 [Helicobacter pylori UM114]EQL70049.1 hypothetical protein N407_05710 [Helicobacter pylori FD662]
MRSFEKKIIKESDDLSDKITAAINYFDGKNNLYLMRCEAPQSN